MEQILVVEDELAIRETIQDILELAGFKVLTACNGKEGYDVIMDSHPDLVLCDVNMPKLGGFELLEAINQRLKDKIIPPFLFLTAKVETEDFRYGMSLGAEDYIFKPFEANDILQAVRLRIDKRKNLLGHRANNRSENLVTEITKLALPCDDGIELIAFDKVIKCQADRAYCNFYFTDNSKKLISKPMKEFEELLVTNNFLKVHKSTIVNTQHIEKFIRGKAGHLLMSDGSIVNVSVRKKEEIMNRLKMNS